MIENGGLDEPTKRVNPWIWLLLVLGLIVGFVLLLYFGAGADASGGCGGG